jgi:hypothetical protein
MTTPKPSRAQVQISRWPWPKWLVTYSDRVLGAVAKVNKLAADLAALTARVDRLKKESTPR